MRALDSPSILSFVTRISSKRATTSALSGYSSMALANVRPEKPEPVPVYMTPAGESCCDTTLMQSAQERAFASKAAKRRLASFCSTTVLPMI